ncbi:MAG: DsbE family thiol:disulfide interchange protein [Gammaproteobacteria bacterium]|nr:DsbE family thiol:disulfide interchange protein [Gammaproteobacteria bacterium]
MRRALLWLPLGVFAILAAFFFRGLSLDPNAQPSALIGRPVPAFALSELHSGAALTGQDLPQGPYLLNVWASWCITCQVEHPYLTELSKTLPIVGLNYKDERTAAQNWLAKLGDPYVLHLFDVDGQLGLDLGVAGAPETFVVDATGVIRARVQGEVNARTYARIIAPALAAGRAP